MHGYEQLVSTVLICFLAWSDHRHLGIQEYRLRLKVGPWDGLREYCMFSSLPYMLIRVGNEGHWDWRMYDVGGCRTARAAWLPFFENTNVIIFLCPISCFDERLEEDQHVNRLEDSMILWRSICSSQLLTKTQLILFLNKVDQLKLKLQRGVPVKKFVTSYGDRPNEMAPVVKCEYTLSFPSVVLTASPLRHQRELPRYLEEAFS